MRLVLHEVEATEERCVEQRGGELAHAASDVFGEDAVVDDTSRDKTIGGGTFAYVPIEREGSARLDDCTPHYVGHPLDVDDPVLVGGVFGGELTNQFGDAKVCEWCQVIDDQIETDRRSACQDRFEHLFADFDLAAHHRISSRQADLAAFDGERPGVDVALGYACGGIDPSVHDLGVEFCSGRRPCKIEFDPAAELIGSSLDRDAVDDEFDVTRRCAIDAVNERLDLDIDHCIGGRYCVDEDLLAWLTGK